MADTSTTTAGAHSSGGLQNELKGDAQRLGDTARDQAESKASQGKEQVTSTAHSASSAMSKAAEELRQDDNAPEWLASAVSGAARQIDDLANRLQDKSPRDIANETRKFAQQSPTAFLSASAIAGFAVARFLRAGAEYQHDDHTGSSSSSGMSTGSSSTGGMGSSTSGMGSSTSGLGSSTGGIGGGAGASGTSTGGMGSSTGIGGGTSSGGTSSGGMGAGAGSTGGYGTTSPTAPSVGTGTTRTTSTPSNTGGKL